MSKKTKILFITTTPAISGAEKMLLHLATNIDKSKYEVIVCSIKASSEGTLLEKLAAAGVTTHSLNVNKKHQLIGVISFYKLLKDFSPDILQSFLFFDNIIARLFGRLTKTPVIISGQRNVETHRSLLRNFLEKITLPLATCVVSNSIAGKKILVKRERFSGEKIKVIYNCVPEQTKATPLSLDKSKQHLLFVGRLSEQKGLTTLLDALCILKNKNTHLTLIGEGEQLSLLKKIVSEKELDSRVSFLGRKEDAWQYFNNFSLLVLSSWWEGTPNVVLEAMQQKVVVVSTSVGGVNEIIEDGVNGFLVPPKDATALAEKIDFVLGLSPQERFKIGEAARKTVEEKFSVKKMVSEYETLYQKLTGSLNN